MRLDAVQNETCFFETNSDDKFNLGDLSGINVDQAILEGTDLSVVYDICNQSVIQDVDREEPMYSVCKVG